MQMVGKDAFLKNWHTVKHEYDLQNNLYFQWMQLISAIPSNWKNIIKQNNGINTFTTTQHHFIRNSRVLTVQKASLKELYWIPIATVKHNPTLQKYLEKKFNDLSLDWKETYMTPRIASRNNYMRCFQYKVLNNVLFLNKKLFLFKKSNSPFVLFVNKKMKLYSICIFIVQTLEISGIN